MDIVRSCYETDFRFFPGAPDERTRVRYFFVPNDTPFVPYPSAFGSRVWEYQEEPDPPFGELNGPRAWRGGQRPAQVGNGAICGTPKQWSDGCDINDPIPPRWPGTTVPMCCGAPTVAFDGGTGVSEGNTPPPLISCAQVATFPADMIVTVLSGLDGCGVADGTQFPATLFSGDPVAWSSVPFELGAWFGQISFYCGTATAGRFTIELVGGFDASLWGISDTPTAATVDPPYAEWTVTIDNGGFCPCTSVRLAVSAP